MLICGILCGFFIFFSRMIFYLFWRKKDKLNTFWRKKKCIMIRRSRLCWVWSSRQCEFLFFACDSSCLWSRKLCVRKLITRIINNTLIIKTCFASVNLTILFIQHYHHHQWVCLIQIVTQCLLRKRKVKLIFFKKHRYLVASTRMTRISQLRILVDTILAIAIAQTTFLTGPPIDYLTMEIVYHLGRPLGTH